MSIILKFILKNIKEKKLRTLLIVISITASTALFFAANGIANVFKDTAINQMKSYFGSAEIMITPNDKSPSNYVMSDKAEIYKDKFDYIVGENQTNGTYKHTKDDIVPFSLTGVDYDDIMEMNPIDFDNKLQITPFQGNKIIISKKSADQYNLKLGSRLELNIRDNNQYFTIVGISKNEGLFKTESSTSFRGIIPKDTAGVLNNARGKVSMLFLKTKNSDDKEQLIKQLSDVYKNYDVRETIDMKMIDSAVGSITTAFMAMLVIVLTMSVFIVYTVFKVIIVERLPIIGTFRSIGATRGTTNFVLIAESIIYGLIGGLIGDLLGIGIVKLAGFGLSLVSKIDITINYSVPLLLESIVFAIVISFVSAIIPIIRASRLSVKDVVLNTVDTVEKKKVWKLAVGVIFLIAAIVIPKVISGRVAFVLDVLSMVLGVVAIIILVPYITGIFTIILERVYALIFGNEGVLAAKNLRSNKNILNNVSLLTIGISAMFMLNVLGYSFGQELVKAYQISNCDIFINSTGYSIDKEQLAKIRNTDGVSDIYGAYDAGNIEIEGTNTKIADVMSYNSKNFEQFMNVNYIQDKNSVLKDFEDDRNIILNETIRKSINASVGDVITLKTNSGDKNYKVVGSFNSLMENGSMALVPEKYVKQDFKMNVCDVVFVMTNKDANKVCDSLKTIYKGKKVMVMTWKDMQDQNAKSIDQMLAIIKIFPMVSLFIGAFGVLNNFIISFIERKRYLAIYASVGMSKTQTIKMLFVEALSVGLVGAIMGMLGGLVCTNIIPDLLKSVFPMEMHYQAGLFVTCLILGMVITLVSSIVPSLKSSKLNIIEAIKYE